MNKLGKLILGIALQAAFLFQTNAQDTYKEVPIKTDGNPRGYQEYLPASYYTDIDRNFAVVIYLHGLGEGGNGDTDLSMLRGNGPNRLITQNHSLNGIFDENDIIVLSPQITPNTWWKHNFIRPFLDYVKQKYRIDSNRIYFTGHSSGASGIQSLLNYDENAAEIAAACPTGVRGKLNSGLGAQNASQIAYWGLTAIGDASNTITASVDRTAAYISDGQAELVMDNYEGSDVIRTATYTIENGWVWTKGIVPSQTLGPQMTLAPGSGHGSNWVYDNIIFWDWLFAQSKAAVTPEPEPEPEAGVVYAINVGGEALTSVDGIEFQADEYYSTDNFSNFKSTTRTIAGTEDHDIYNSYRYGYGQMNYVLPVENGTYKVKLMFCEQVKNQIGLRVFDVTVNGYILQSALDVVKETGAYKTAFDLETEFEVKEGAIVITTDEIIRNGMLSGILVERL